MKKYLQLLVSIIGCELVGILGAVFTASSIPDWYAYLNKPFFSPPNWVFGPVWTILYALMGISVWLVWQKGIKKKKVRIAIQFFAVQLTLNFVWTPIFFGLRSPLLALPVIAAMWVFIVLTIKQFYPLSKIAAWFLIPYLLWVSFASVLNLAIVIVN